MNEWMPLLVLLMFNEWFLDLINNFIELKGYKAKGRILDMKRRMSGYSFEKIDNLINNDIPENHKSVKTNNENSVKDDNEELTLF